MSSLSGYDEADYALLLKKVGAMSQLFSDNEAPFIVPRFAERLFVYVTKGRDLARDDKSFDALISGNVGIGIKTFTKPSATPGVKSEKVAEFTRDATLGRFRNLPREELANIAASLRNDRVTSDAGEYAIDLSKSLYHCLIRIPGGAVIHEEPYSIIDLDGIRPTDSNGNNIGSFAAQADGHIHFTDGVNKYTYNTAKNVLYKKFDTRLYFNSSLIDIPIEANILARLAGEGAIQEAPRFIKPAYLDNMDGENDIEEGEAEPFLTSNDIVLPLYSTRTKNVEPSSGINQWNAAGRDRVFGEAYIPIPSWIHRDWPDFFPEKDVKFRVRLPNGQIISAKAVQQGRKALMSDPNKDICAWLFPMIDGSMEAAQGRMGKSMPYTYKDLARIGKDSVRITKLTNDPYADYELVSAPTGSYAAFAGVEAPSVDF